MFGSLELKHPKPIDAIEDYKVEYNVRFYFSYNRILHSNLSFPLLKRLRELGDPKAKRVFAEEIVSRYLEGNETVRRFLRVEEYLLYLNEEERRAILVQDYTCENCNVLFQENYYQMENVRFKLCSTCLNTFSIQERETFERKKELEWLRSEFGENFE